MKLFEDKKCYTNETLDGWVLVGDEDAPGYLKYYRSPTEKFRWIVVWMWNLDGDLSDLTYVKVESSSKSTLIENEVYLCRRVPSQN